MPLTKTGQVNALANGEKAQAPERRAQYRFQTVMRVARVITAQDEGLARIKNISNDGALLRLLMPVTPNDTLTIQLADHLNLSGRVAWISDGQCGLEFDHAINCATLLSTLVQGQKDRPNRAVRLPVLTSAMTMSERGLRLAKIIDISQRGVKLGHDGSLVEGLHLQLTLPNGLARCGVVRWTSGNLAGVMLLEPLSVDTLGSAKLLNHPDWRTAVLQDSASGSAD